ncbi:MAG: hypothetical protein J6C11_06085 [Spirochaetaceae bacterium]|nr:hypothetical protein [Spirochaetaceae bacterium]
MKIVFSTIPMQIVNPVVYKSEENKAIEYGKPTRFPINSLLAKTLQKDDEVKVVRIITEGEFSEQNGILQQEELDNINETIGANIKYVAIRASFRETSEVVQYRFREIIRTLENGCEIYTDMTYGPKTLIPVLFYSLGFAEKFFDADVRNIIYGKAVFNKNKEIKSDDSELFDVTPLYYLNSLTGIMTAPDGKTALERLDRFFEL